MNSRDAMKSGMKLATMICDGYLDDLSDDDMMHRPDPKCNHIKWQLGHLITSEHNITDAAAAGFMPPLPEGFAERYTKETAASDDPSAFDSKETLLQLYREQRQATLKALDAQTDETLDGPMPEAMAGYAATVGDAFALQGAHWIMHAGQWAVIRRQLGREPLF